MSASGIFPNDAWTVARATTPEGPLLARYRSADPSAADRALFDKLVLVRWSYAPIEGTGLPRSPDVSAMDAFEDRIIEASDADGSWGACVAVVTHNAVREWRFYTPDVALFLDGFNRALAGQPAYPVELTSFADPDWSALSELRGSAA